MAKKGHRIRTVLPGGIAWELGVEAGDELLQIDGEEIGDIFDYRMAVAGSEFTALIRKADGEEWLLEIEKGEEEELGLEFASALMDDYRSCRNRCIFCFIDQMPPGMRETLYFKDDDSRLSFLQGNYITLTNMSAHDVDRIIRLHMEPINISFHATDPELRARMLGNRRAGDIYPTVRRLADAGIEMNGQIVLCKGWNDGEQLERSIRDLSAYRPALRSVSVVPVGLTRYREGLVPLENFSRQEAGHILDQIEGWQRQFRQETGSGLVYASDEWYLLAGRPLPEEADYDGYPQLENGVGMLRSLEKEVTEALDQREAGSGPGEELSLATGELAAPFLEGLLQRIRAVHPEKQVRVYPIRNDFFGDLITVSGLLTGQDLLQQLPGKELGNRILLPCNMFRAGERVFLDDCTVDGIEKQLGVPVTVVGPSGEDLVAAVLGDRSAGEPIRRQIYEQTCCGDRRETERR